MRPLGLLLRISLSILLSSLINLRTAQADAPTSLQSVHNAEARVAAASPTPLPSAQPSQAPVQSNLKKMEEEFVDADLLSDTTIKTLRDPFQPPALTEIADKPKSELERYPVDQYELLGVITGPAHVRAVVRSPTSESIVVGENMSMGVRKGRVVRITPTSMVVRQKEPNVLGQEEDVEYELRLMAKATKTGGG